MSGEDLLINLNRSSCIWWVTVAEAVGEAGWLYSTVYLSDSCGAWAKMPHWTFSISASCPTRPAQASTVLVGVWTMNSSSKGVISPTLNRWNKSNKSESDANLAPSVHAYTALTVQPDWTQRGHQVLPTPPTVSCLWADPFCQFHSLSYFHRFCVWFYKCAVNIKSLL